MAKRMVNTMRIAAAYNASNRGRDDGQRMEYHPDYMRGDRGDTQYTEQRRNTMQGEGYVTWDSLHEPVYRGEDEPDEPRGNITDMRRYNRVYPMRSHMEPNQQHHRGMTQQRQIGFGPEQRRSDHEEWDNVTMDHETAERWVRSMTTAEGTRGGKWKSMQDVKALAQSHGMGGEKELPAFWAALNATYSDAVKVAKKYNVDRPDFYADLACALYFDDTDAVPDKLMAYYQHIVKKD